MPTETLLMSRRCCPLSPEAANHWPCCPLRKAHCALCLTGEKMPFPYLGIEAALPTPSCLTVSRRVPYENSSFSVCLPPTVHRLNPKSVGPAKGTSLRLHHVPWHLLPSRTWAPCLFPFQATRQSKPSGSPALPVQQTSLVLSESQLWVTAENRLTWAFI